MLYALHQQVVQGKPAWVWLSKLGKQHSSSSSSGSSSKSKGSSNTQRNTVFIGLSPLTAAAHSAAATAAASVNGKLAAVDNLCIHVTVLPIAHV
jgi:flagellar hook-length control protein FliK